MRIFVILWMCVALGAALISQPTSAGEPANVPEEDFVPTAEVAIAIAVAVWGPIYGAEHIAKQKPYHAKLIDGVWWVSGSLKPGWLGGVAEARIQKVDGRVLGVTHGK